MVDCCELALYNGQLALRIALGAFALVALWLVMFFGYNLKVKKKQIELSQRTKQLEKKNGKEETLILAQQTQINELKLKIDKLEEANKNKINS